MSHNPEGLSVGVFAKYPEPGQVKTRLIPLLGSEGAAQFARFLLLRSLSCLLSMQAKGHKLEVWLWRSGGEDTKWQQLLAPVLKQPGASIKIAQQNSEHLGARMAQALTEQLESAPRAMLVGTDAIEFAASDVAQIEQSLSIHSLVYVPAQDGGYVAVGCAGKVPAVFGDSIEWGSERVLRQSLTAAKKSGVAVACLDAQMDVDEPEDFERALTRGFIPSDWKAQFNSNPLGNDIS